MEQRYSDLPGAGEGARGWGDQTVGLLIMVKFEITVFIFMPPLGAARSGLFIGVTLLVSAILIQPIPIIFGVGQLMMTNTNNSDLWYQPAYDDRHQRCPPI
jgi:hypothetical protein